jgi:cobyrinic acid a,c-diamide synthase
LTEETLPPMDGLYIGGGFPETHAEVLAANREFRRELYRRIHKGFPVYAECGGLMYLGRELVLEGRSYAMAGVLPVVFGLSRRPRGHGYTIIRVERDNPYYTVGSEIRGHEFHYSHVLEWQGRDEDLIFGMQRGTGFYRGRDGVRFKNVLATYTHTHALGTTQWARGLVRQAAAYRNLQTA